MADIFSGAVNFSGATLRQKAAPANLKDYAHASRLFVGNNYSLVPKSSFLFHVYIDINGSALQLDSLNPNASREIGLMVKSAELPKFSTESKTYNSYNRANIVQTKIKYDSITITFNDDSSNLVRSFWVSYFKHYYRDSDYSLSQDSVNQKYSDQLITEFGLSPRSAVPYLRSIRIYSLHQKRFSEYILVNPIIKSFRHGQHVQGESDTMKHEMTVEYETVIYSGGSSSGGMFGFADLHYDTSSSPIMPAGGYIDPHKAINNDHLPLNYGVGQYNAANTVINARSSNLKSAAMADMTNAFNSSLRTGGASNKVIVPNLFGTPGAVTSPFNGINLTSSLATLAGAGMSAGTRTPVSNADTTVPTGNYNRTFPLDSTAVPVVTVPSTLKLLNDQRIMQSSTTGQQEVNLNQQKRALANKIVFVGLRITQLTDRVFATNNVIINSTTTITALNSKYTSVQSLPDTTPNKDLLLSQIQQSINLQTTVKDDATKLYTSSEIELNNFTQDLSSLKAERDTLV